MSLDKRCVTFLLNLVQRRRSSSPVGGVARQLSVAHSIGSLSGTKLLYASTDFLRASELLRLMGIDPSTAPDAWRALGRTDSASLRGNEKWAGQSVSSGLVAVTCVHGQRLVVAGANLALPARSHLVLPVEDVAKTCQHTTLIIVENFESFRRCSLWHSRYLSQCGADPLFIYRGDKEGTRAGAVNFLLANTTLPVLAACDIDPAGLGIALTLPRLTGLVAPPPDELDQHLRSNTAMSSGRADLYAKQYAQWAQMLDASVHEEIRLLWAVIRRHGQGVVQEAFLELGGLADMTKREQ